METRKLMFAFILIVNYGRSTKCVVFALQTTTVMSVLAARWKHLPEGERDKFIKLAHEDKIRCKQAKLLVPLDCIDTIVYPMMMKVLAGNGEVRRPNASGQQETKETRCSYIL